MPAEPEPATMRCGVLGNPVAHSLSPVLHRAAYRELGLDWVYDAHEVGEDGLAGFMSGLSAGWRGLSLTMPLKRAVIDLCDDVEPRARTLGSVNTVVIGPAGRHGYNTDVIGFVRALREAGIRGLGSVVVVGGGATAASALAAAADLGARRATVLARSTRRAAALATLGPSLGLQVDLRDMTAPVSSLRADAVISTIPATGQASVDIDAVAALAPVVFDVVYVPASTPLLEAARAGGRQVIDGFSLLLHQAARQVELMTGREEAPVEVMRAAGLTGLAALGHLPGTLPPTLPRSG